MLIPRSRRAVLAAVPGALMAAGLLISTGGVYAQDATPATPGASTVGVLDPAPEGLPECGASEIGSLPSDVEAAKLYTIVADESEARYVAQEELAQVGATTAIGKTQAIAGSIGFDEAGLPLACSRIDVDMRTLVSDQARRDNYLYNNTLEAEKYPLATFVFLQVDGLDAPLADGETKDVTLIGNLTLRETTKVVAWEAEASMDGDNLVIKAKTNFDMPDFGITPPSVPVVLSLDENVALEFDMTAAPAA
ncbi:MAG: YceI family protein [Thermomicrobiales bacterium]